MKPLLKSWQKYAIVIGVLTGLTALTGLSGIGSQQVDDAFGQIVGVMVAVAFGTVPGLLGGLWAFLNQIPLVVLILIGGAIFFTFRFDFVNLRGGLHALKIVSGKYDDPDNPGEVSHFQALSTALSATVGLGNIAGVAIAVSMGGPGAVFWMMAAAVFGMTSKFAECTLGQIYRKVDAKGAIQGGPMIYLRDGLAEIGMPTLGKYLAVIFAVLCIGGSFGGGNMFQSNQSFQAATQLIPWMGGAKATGTVTIQSPMPIQLDDHPRHLIKFLAGEHAETDGRPVSFIPTEGPVTITAADWSRDAAGMYNYSIDVRATDSGSRFNLAPSGIATISLGTVEGRQVEWAEVETATVINAAPFSGGEPHRGWLYGIIIALLVGLVIIGGIKSIGNVASKIVPTMCVLYVVTSVAILLMHFAEIPGAVATIIGEAFNPQAGLGGLVGVLIIGIQRAAFSNEAGIGSAAIAHSAAKTKEPVREGFVALLEPFIDTIVICFMTGIVIVITGVYADPATAGLNGVELTTAAFGTVLWWFPYILSGAVILFAFSTMISWSYYGERCWAFLFGPQSSLLYRTIFLGFIVLGAVTSLGNVIDFSDLMILSMAFPNILGVVLLSGKINEALQSYWKRLRSGEFDLDGHS
ncbi:MAG: alanine/glycine:cation symporter family protein [Bradymonadaceae bacterium]